MLDTRTSNIAVASINGDLSDRLLANPDLVVDEMAKKVGRRLSLTL